MRDYVRAILFVERLLSFFILSASKEFNFTLLIFQPLDIFHRLHQRDLERCLRKRQVELAKSGPFCRHTHRTGTQPKLLPRYT